MDLADALRSKIRDIPDFPQPGVVFKDITPLLADGPSFGAAIGGIVDHWSAAGDRRPATVVGIESRGFLLAAPVADRLGAGVTLVRKPGKLPWKTVREEYALEYGTDALEIHEDALAPGEPVLVVDDVLATGGTAAATVRLVEKLGGRIVGCAFLVELGFLDGRRRLGELDVQALVTYP
jgi:adenine phosphoribosyltransferase